MHQIIDDLIQKYKENDYVSSRLVNYIENLLPAALESDALIHRQREERKKQLLSFKDEFTTRFLHKNKYFYSSQTELFLMYDGMHFVIYSEDDIQHQILTTITSEQSLKVWKHKIKNNIIKRIKEMSLLNAIPESTTIQSVINSIYPAIFATRNEAKYFLTIVGDCILNSKVTIAETSSATTHAQSAAQKEEIIYLISPAAKEFLREISNECYTFLGISNVFSNIKYKFYDHNYALCRLIHTNEHISKVSPPNKYMLDLLCVAAHYSKRYLSADNFLKQCSDTKLADHAFYLHKNTLEKIVDNFMEEMLTKTPSSLQHNVNKIDSKNMFFLWKRFLDARHVPNIVFQGSLKTMFKSKMIYEESSDAFLNVASSYLPLTANFLRFWETTIVCETTPSLDESSELEIDEITKLFKSWVTGSKANMNINEEVILKMIRHFYPEVVIEDEKYIMHIKCSLWDKHNEVVNSLDMFKYECNAKQQTVPSSLYDAYEFYSSLMNKNNKKNQAQAPQHTQAQPQHTQAQQHTQAPQHTQAQQHTQTQPQHTQSQPQHTHQHLASKRYFEKISYEIISHVHFDGDGMILPTWWR